jgi:hypothetical protein
MGICTVLGTRALLVQWVYVRAYPVFLHIVGLCMYCFGLLPFIPALAVCHVLEIALQKPLVLT